MITSLDDLADAVRAYGFLPFFRCIIPTLSVEELADKSIWFPDDGLGIWDWKSDCIRITGGAYGRFFHRAPGFVSGEMLPLLLAYRRDGYDFDGFTNDRLAKPNEKHIYSILEETGEESSTYLKAKCGLSESSFEKAITSLQMKGFIVVSGFDYKISRSGAPYGWGITRYAIPEAVFGETLTEEIDRYRPDQALTIMKEHLQRRLPDTEDYLIEELLSRRN